MEGILQNNTRKVTGLSGSSGGHVSGSVTDTAGAPDASATEHRQHVKDRLSDYEYINKAIHCKLATIEQINAQIREAMVLSEPRPERSDAVASLLFNRMQVSGQLEDLVCELLRLMKIITSVTDPLLEIILTMRYLCGKE